MAQKTSTAEGLRPAADSPVLWQATAKERDRAKITRFLRWLEETRGLKFADYGELWRWSVEDIPGFWESVWQFFDVQASTTYRQAVEGSTFKDVRWFPGAHLNYAGQVFAAGAAGGNPALMYVRETGEPLVLSWTDMRGQVGALAASLRLLGVVPGDRVAAYLPNIPEAVVSLLAVASIGAIWTACAPDFGTRSVLDRFGQVKPKVLIAADGYTFAGREHDRLDVIAGLKAALPSVEHTVLVRNLRPHQDAPTVLHAFAFEELVRDYQEPQFEQVGFDHPLWVLFSSGTTGLPKGLVHSHGGIVIEHLKSLGLCLDVRDGDRWLFYTSTSWMAWNYLVGGLMHGATPVLYEGSPSFPEVDTLWRVAEQTETTILGMGAAYVTGCEKSKANPAADLSLSSLRIVIPTGSPLPPKGWRWLHNQIDPEVRIDPMCGGTDVCTAFFGTSVLLPIHSGKIPCRWLGVNAQAYDAAGRAVTGGVGEFVVTAPMPSMPLYLWNDPGNRRLSATYFDKYQGVWRQGDWIILDDEGRVTVLGRSDATLNRGGVRLGSAEIYAVVEGVDDIADSLVVGVELPDGSYYMPLFVSAAPGKVIDDRVRDKLAVALRRDLSPRHVPDEIVEAPMIPRTKTGKKLEVPIKRMLQGVSADEVAAVGAVDRPEAVEWFADFARKHTVLNRRPG